MKWIIVGRQMGSASREAYEELDEADDEETADYLVAEYQIAFGPSWSIWKLKKIWKEKKHA